MQLKGCRSSVCGSPHLWQRMIILGGLRVLAGGWLVLGLSPRRISAVRTGLE